MTNNVIQMPGTVRQEQGPRRFSPPPIVVNWAAKRRQGLANLQAMNSAQSEDLDIKLRQIQNIVKIKIRDGSLSPKQAVKHLEDCISFLCAMRSDEPA